MSIMNGQFGNSGEAYERGGVARPFDMEVDDPVLGSEADLTRLAIEAHRDASGELSRQRISQWLTNISTEVDREYQAIRVQLPDRTASERNKISYAHSIGIIRGKRELLSRAATDLLAVEGQDNA